MSTETPEPTNKPIPGETDQPALSSESQHAGQGHRIVGLGPKLARLVNWRFGALILVLATSILIWRAMSGRAGAIPAPAHAQPVAVARVTREDLFKEVTIPAEFRPYLKVELHAKVSGYVDQINVDIGDQVKAGQLLARLEVPELRDELARAKAAEKRAEADYKDAHLIYTRLLAVEKEHPNLVAQQELDAAESKDATTEAAIAAAKAEVQKEQTLLGYTQIIAPFDGVITRRYADPGSLIQAGTASDTQSMPLVCLSDNYRLRLDTAVSVDYVKDIHVGDQLDVLVESLKNKVIKGTISRVAQKVDDETRTMLTEIDVPNPKLELVPGMYAKAVLKVQPRAQALVIPIEAVPPGQSPSVYVINQQNQIEERPVTTGLETPDKCEVLTGLKEGEMVLIGSRSRVRVGQKVEAKLKPSLAQQ
jgi:RND family efflux transporter MFP subunit